jgi:hypothetical protein
MTNQIKRATVMQMLSNPRHEHFAQYLAQGKPEYEAYRLAGYVDDRGNACKQSQQKP